MTQDSRLRNISPLHYITQDLPDKSHQQLAEEACIAGVSWVQLRVKNKPIEEWLQIAKEVVEICRRHSVTVVINDNPEIALKSGADGVHLGKEDITPIEARKILGEGAFIGGTANTAEDIQRLQAQGVNYIGLGPFRFTSTKEKLSPVLGIDGVKEILTTAQPQVPVVVIGGIVPEDVTEILAAGAFGIAVSSAINLAENKKEVVASFRSSLNEQKTKHPKQDEIINL
jgi:thiamine-phosphate pyrophosphorylase